MYTKIIAYALQNGKTEADLDGKVELQDNSDGNGPFISKWEMDIPEPSKADLDALATEADALQQKKVAKLDRGNQVEALTVTTVAGNEFNANEQSQERMTRAVLVLNDAEETDWKLADDSWIKASKEELKEALRLAGEAQTQIWKQADQV